MHALEIKSIVTWKAQNINAQITQWLAPYKSNYIMDDESTYDFEVWLLLVGLLEVETLFVPILY